MLSALGDPPDSGLTRSAIAPGARARRPTTTARAASPNRRKRRDVRDTGPNARASLSAGEVRKPLLDEGHHALDEVVRAGHLALDLGLELELLVEAPVDAVVELALGPGIGLRGPGGQPVDQLGHALVEL